MSRVLILNRYRLQSAAFHRWLAPEHELYLLNDARRSVESHPEHDAIRRRYRRIAEFDDYLHDPALLATARAWITEHGIDTVVAFSEYDVQRAAELRDAFGLRGQGLASANAFRDKLVMKHALAEHGVPVVPFASLVTADDLHAFVADVGLPVVIKPRTGADSQGIVVASDLHALEAFISAAGDLSAYLAEAWTAHELLHSDGVWVDGQVVFSEMWSWSKTMLDVRDAPLPTTAVTLDLDDPRRTEVLELTRRTMAALPSPPATAFHIEFFARPDGLVVNEAASRVGGGRIQPTIRRLRNVDIVELTARVQTGSQVGPPVEVRAAANGGFLLAYNTGAVVGTAPATCSLAGITHYETSLPLPTGPAEVAAPELLLSGVAIGPDAVTVQDALLTFHRWFLDNVDNTK